ncbi:nuclear transport factor 2 family protein [Niallia nealsonii]|uniref:DNA-binding protein n=1 Tax=Niallia nealsonii TaxID=115979 RepID=A0A2N0Z1R6_9BACI|nr:DNA-binding protein [Niallia nealsonii]PKG23454.1 DNA-binding protein [Niallia nealsonii]
MENQIKIICPIDCGNAPKKQVLKEVCMAFALKEITSILEELADNITWNNIGQTSISGKEQVKQALIDDHTDQPTEIHIETIITHGNTGFVNGMVLMKNHHNYAFCHVYQFTSAGKKGKIKEITSYIIKLI